MIKTIRFFDKNDPPYDAIALPNSWYFFCLSKELKKGRKKIISIGKRQIIIYRGSSGKPYAAENICPHMGGMLHKGKIRKDSIVCPIHNFEFDKTGHLQQTTFGIKNRGEMCLERVPIVEKNGIILFFYHKYKEAPWYDITFPDTENWSDISFMRLAFNTNPFYLTQDVSDTIHYAAIHKFRNVRYIQPPVTDGAKISSRVMMDGYFGLKRYDIEVNHQSIGFGFGVNETTATELGLTIRYYILSRPVTRSRMYLICGVSIKLLENFSNIHPLLSKLPKKLLTKIITPLTSVALYFHLKFRDRLYWEDRIYTPPTQGVFGITNGAHINSLNMYLNWSDHFYCEEDKLPKTKYTKVQR
ncbi:hypothetical protein AB835_12815 [Candidatus Endobugula sertula]|uniref:Rieske domain-containing protein n=1 Tax=Candidatus Endobugula sertula TaxID=62101 RepID=A0A1D2QMB0_9GAMM|nr:hypothetical protein AB835_12815 [Candidatus Endobugula sertula]